MSLGDAQTGEEMWLIRGGRLVSGFDIDKHHPWWQEVLVAIQIDGEWFVMRRADITAKMKSNPSQGLRGLIAHESRVLEEELECFKLPEIPIGTWSHGTKVSEAWQVNLSAQRGE
jgi:hypothetical protein